MTEHVIRGYGGREIRIDLSTVMTEKLPAVQTREERDTPLEKRRIIAWDGEGMKLSGDDRPQHYVMFGCSAEPEFVLVSRNLKTMDILEYIIAVGERYPNAVHIGYGFRYDCWMIVKGLPDKYLRELKYRNEVTFKLGSVRWRIHVIPGKSFRVTKRWSSTRKNLGKRSGDGYVSVKIDDMVAFFACPFLVACESILGMSLDAADREVIAHGKDSRGHNEWNDLPDVRRYWAAEIKLMQRMAETFREVMFSAGIRLKEWYGPGAIASYLIRTRKLRDHIQNEPPIKEVHDASKIAYAGGRFELFRVGRIRGPVFGYDINSAYPHALSNAPSLGEEHGEWVHVNRPDTIEEFGVYRITYRHMGNPRVVEHAAMPLFHRNTRGGISFPQVNNGWYWSPEARAAQVLGGRYPGSVMVHEGWVWRHDSTYPFKFLEEMFLRRIELGKKNIVSMPYKLGPNSMYGKLAQRVGWDQKHNRPPKSHCLPLAGWITSHCRARLFNLMLQIPPHKLIAVETDGVYTTADPDSLRIDFGGGLGQWDTDEYSEMLYLQNGVYHRRTPSGTWLPPKARGLDIASVSREVVADYMQSGTFDPLRVSTRERFIGLNAAFVKGRGLHIKEHLGKWEPGTRDMIPGGKGKRIHLADACAECHQGLTMWDSPHRLAIQTKWAREIGEMSTPHSLPWEEGPVLSDMEQYRELDVIAEDLIPLEMT